jgi:hypothetical protein
MRGYVTRKGDAESPGSGGASPYLSRCVAHDVAPTEQIDQTTKEFTEGSRHKAGRRGKPRFGRSLTLTEPHPLHGFLSIPLLE